MFDEADDALRFPVSQMCFAGTEEELKQTANTQPCILDGLGGCVSRACGEADLCRNLLRVTAWANIRRWWPRDRWNFADAVRLVRKRGTFMQEAVPPGEGAMAAILGLSPAQVSDICKRAADGEVCSPANLNSPEQTVISGNAAAVKRAVELASQNGAKRAVVLPVSAPFHCALMQPAQAKMEPELARNKILRFARAA